MPVFCSGKDSLLVTQSTSQRTNQFFDQWVGQRNQPEEPASLTINHAVNHTVKYPEKQKKQPPCQSFPATSELGICLPPWQQTNQPTTLPSQVSCQDVTKWNNHTLTQLAWQPTNSQSQYPSGQSVLLPHKEYVTFPSNALCWSEEQAKPEVWNLSSHAILFTV